MVRPNGGPTYREVLAQREFRYLWLADLASIAGDQVARIALSLLVFSRTGSPALTGLTYGLTFVPTLLGSVFLTGLADHYPRRSVMVVADLVRAVLIALVAVPHLPLWLLCVLVAVSTLFNGPFRGSQQALLPEVLPERVYVLGVSLRTVSSQVAQLAGFAVGGVVVTLLSPEGALLLDALTFVVSALLLTRVAPRPVPQVRKERAVSPRGLARGFTAYRHDRRLLVLGAFAALNLFHIVPEGTAAPYAHQLGVGSYGVALILASAPLGAAVGAFVFGRFVPDALQPRLIGPAALVASLALVPAFALVGLPVSLVLFAVAGGLSAIYSMYCSAMIARTAPEGERARVSGVYTAIVSTANGLGPMLGGLVAGRLGAAAAIGVAGVASAVLAVVVTLAWTAVRRTRPPVDAAA